MGEWAGSDRSGAGSGVATLSAGGREGGWVRKAARDRAGSEASGRAQTMERGHGGVAPAESVQRGCSGEESLTAAHPTLPARPATPRRFLLPDPLAQGLHFSLVPHVFRRRALTLQAAVQTLSAALRLL